MKNRIMTREDENERYKSFYRLYSDVESIEAYANLRLTLTLLLQISSTANFTTWLSGYIFEVAD